MTTVLDLKAAGGKTAADELKQLLKPLEEVGGHVTRLAKQGGLSRAVSGDKKDRDQFSAFQKQLKSSLDDQVKSLARIQAQMKSTSDLNVFRDLAMQADDFESQIEQTRQEIDALETSFKKTGKAASFLKNMPDDMDFGGGMGGMGMGGGLGALSSLGDLAGMLSGGGGPLDGLSQLISTAQQAQGALEPLTEGVSTFLAGAKGGKGPLGALSGGLGGLVGMMNPASLATAGLGLALGAVTASFDASARAAEKEAEARDRAIEAARQLRDLEYELSDIRMAGDLQTNKDMEKQKQRSVEQAKNDADTFAAELEYWKQQVAIAEDINKIGQGFDLGRAKWIRENKLPEIEQNLTQALETVGTSIQEVQKVTGAIPATEIKSQINAFDDALSGLAEASFLDNITEAANNVKATKQSLADLSSSFAEELASFYEDLSWQAERQSAERAREDEQSLTAHTENLTGMLEEHNKALQDIDKELNKSLADLAASYAEQNAEASKQLEKGLADIDEQFRESEQESIASFYESLADMDETYQDDSLERQAAYDKERRRREEDRDRDLASAERANDVLAFIQAEEQANLDLQRMDEDFNDEKAKADEQFQQERAQAEEEHQQTLADLRDQAADQRAELLEQYEEEKALRAEEHTKALAEARAQAAEQVAQQKEAYAEQRLEAQKAFEKEKAQREEQRAWDDQWADKETARQRQKTQENYDKQRGMLEDQLAKENGLIEAGYAERARLIAAQEKLLTSTMKGESKGSSKGSTKGLTGKVNSSGGFTPFDEGGLITEPTLALMGERPGYNELLLPVPKGQGLPSNLGTQDNRSWNFYGEIANGMSRSEVESMFQGVFEAFAEATA